MGSTLSNQGKTSKEQIEVISESRLRNMTKLDGYNLFSCHKEVSSSGTVFHAIFFPESKSLWKSENEREVRALCAKLNPLNEASSGLEALMKIVKREPTWSAFHYAVACGFLNYVHFMIQKEKDFFINFNVDGRFPLHIALESGQIEVLHLLINAGAPLTQKDSLGRTVVHLAAEKTATALKILSTESPSSFQLCLSEEDENGMTPLACAIQATNFDSVQFLIGLSPSPEPPKSGLLLSGLQRLKHSEQLSRILELVTTKYPAVVGQTDGSQQTIFHKALDHRVLAAVLRKSSRNVDLNAHDQNRDTALHLAVDRGDLDSVVVLLTSGADIDSVNRAGDTALIKAVMNGNATIVKCLLVFGASLEIRNKQGQDVCFFSANSKNRAEIDALLKIAKSGIDETRLLSPAVKVNEIDEFSQKLALEYQTTKVNQNTVFALSLDGGGIRGLVLIQMLIEIEAKLGRPVMDSFQWLAGTSTGAILALALAQGKGLTYCRNLYFQLKDLVFTGNRVFSAKPLEKLLKEEFGENTTMAQVAKEGKRVMVTTCRGNVCPPELKLLRSYKNCHGEGSEFDDPTKITAWFAARCSSAAPTYFPAVKETWMDGGLIANNPTCELLADIQTHNTLCRMTGSEPEVRIGCVLSLGTGRQPVISSERIDVNLREGFNFEAIVNNITAAMHLKDILLEQVACADGAPVSRSRAWAHSLSAPFFRFSPQLSKPVDLAETDNSVLIEMLWKTKEYMSSESHAVQQLVDFLKKH